MACTRNRMDDVLLTIDLVKNDENFTRIVAGQVDCFVKHVSMVWSGIVVSHEVDSGRAGECKSEISSLP